MRETLTPLLALFLALAALLAGNGLQTTLLSVRANLEQFPITLIGTMMSCYFVGYILGCLVCPFFVRTAGHIRTFAALASLSAIVALLHLLFIDPWIWMGLRIVTGACLAGLAMIAESWINERTSNQSRGRIIAVYRIVDLGSVTAGQLFFTLADPAGFALFCLASILVSIAVIPVSLTPSAAPAPIAKTKLSLGKVFQVSPLAAVGVFGTGLANSAFWGLAPVFVQNAGYSTNLVAVFVTSFVIGGVFMQFPLAIFSDRLDRRHTLNAVTLGSAVASFSLAAMADAGMSVLLPLGFLYGSLTLSIYSLAIAHANDFAAREDFVEVSRSLLLLFGIGAAIGPFLASLFADLFGNSAIFMYMSVIHAVILIYGIYRTFQRPTVPKSDKEQYVPLPRSTPQILELDPRSELHDAAAPGTPTASKETVQSLS